jgi:hypothetical protein
MSHTDKYLKYKNKYLELKNQVGGYNIADLNLRLDTITSWFTSILKFLNNYKYPNLTYYELLDKAGVKGTNLNIDFEPLDIYAQRIANEYNIIIKYSHYSRARTLHELRPRGFMLSSSKTPITVDLFLRNSNGNSIEIYSLNNGENIAPFLESEIPTYIDGL